MEADVFDENAFFRAISESGVRALLIGRRALIMLGLPVMTADYDFWIDGDGIEAFNAALAPIGLVPSRPPDEARRRGRYVLENGEHVDVLVARAHSTLDGERVAFDDLWSRRKILSISGAELAIPSIRDLISTKRFGTRPKDIEDIRALEILLRSDDEQ